MIYFNILCFFIIIILGVVIIKKKEKATFKLMIKMLDGLRSQANIDDLKLPKDIQDDYNITLKKVKKQEMELDNSIEELKEYRDELELTYNSLVVKSSQLEYSNHILERKVENLSNLNSISRSALSELKLDKIINIIIDAYFVLTGAKRISFYLWENGTLKNKKVKGGIRFKGEASFPPEEVKNFNRNDYKKVYEDLSKGFAVNDENEIVLIYPLVVKGKELGVIYIIEDKNKLNDIDEETISALVIQISVAINNAQIYGDLLVKERMSQELEVAARIQQQIIPKDIKRINNLEIANFFQPAKEIGGDYYDYTVIDDNSFSITIADVSGKGVPAAFLLAIGRSILKTLTIVGDTDPEEELDKLNDIIYSDISEDMFITMFHSKYCEDKKTLYYSNAGHNPLIVYSAKEDKVYTCNVKGVAIGFVKGYKYKLGQLNISKGDIVIFYTDGVTEAADAERNLYGINRVKDLLYNNKTKDPDQIKKELLLSIKNFVGDAEQEDDLTFVIIKCVE